MKISIKEPCPANWDKMQIGINSRHCQQCSKNVIDFTSMSRSEIITYILGQPQGSVCGRMNPSQFDFKHEDIPHLVKELKRQPNQKAFLILTLVCLSLSSCKEENRVQPPQGPKTINTEIEMGKVSVQDTLQNIDTTKQIKQIIKKTIKEPDCILEPEVMGEVCVVEKPTLGLVIEEPYGGTISETSEVLKIAEKMPEYPGGVEALFTFIQSNMNYPPFEKENQIQGTVYTSLIINEKGKIVSHKILKSVQGAPNFNKEVERIISLMPNWTPGSNQGKNVSVEYTFPIRFMLQ
jgi:TonB family protein